MVAFCDHLQAVEFAVEADYEFRQGVMRRIGLEAPDRKAVRDPNEGEARPEKAWGAGMV